MAGLAWGSVRLFAGGATDHRNHLAPIKMIKMQGDVFGAVSTSDALIAAMD